MHSFRFEEPDYRHLSQFIHSEAEFMGELKDVIKLVEQYIRFLTRNLKKKHFDKLKKIDGVLERVEKLEQLASVNRTFKNDRFLFIEIIEKYK